MVIKNTQDWIELARKTIPRLNDYSLEFGRRFDEEQATSFLDRGQYISLHGMFSSLWMRLPDSKDIRFGPFFDLCDLCSEDWVLHGPQEPDNDNAQDDPPPSAA